MATVKMTFTLPAELAALFIKRVKSSDRSQYVAEAIAERFATRERQLIESCQAANADPDIAAIEAEFDALPDTMADDPWIDDGR